MRPDSRGLNDCSHRSAARFPDSQALPTIPQKHEPCNRAPLTFTSGVDGPTEEGSAWPKLKGAENMNMCF